MYKLIFMLLILTACNSKNKIYTYKVTFLNNKVDTLNSLDYTCYLSGIDSNVRINSSVYSCLALKVRSISIIEIKEK